ncbi:MAG: accessory factor UbiK family protein [Magnetococcales bacterium]|nr:accessory factor UbiK family protein [Magnetococcales bacterium]
MQIDNTFIDQMTQSFLGVFDKVGQTRDEAARKMRDLVQEAVERFDLVGREEFDTVKELLSNTRIKAEQLEKRLAELEAQLAAKGESAHPEND